MTQMTQRMSEKLQYVLLPAQHCEMGARRLYESAYAFWKEIWRKTFFDLLGKQTLFSDDFLRQDEISVLTFEGQIIGMVTFRWFDLQSESHLDDSYFNTYPREVFHVIQHQTKKKVMMMGYLGIAPEWRRESVGVFTSEVLIGLATKRFLASSADLLISYTRNNRKINELVYRYGAKPLKKGHQAHNVEVDLVMIPRADVKVSICRGIPEIVEKLWARRTAFESIIERGRLRDERLPLQQPSAS